MTATTGNGEFRVWRRDSKIPHNLRLADMSGTRKCEHCGLSETHIIAERLGCIKSLHPKLPQPPPPKRRDWRDWPKLGRR